MSENSVYLEKEHLYIRLDMSVAKLIVVEDLFCHAKLPCNSVCVLEYSREANSS